MNRTRPSSRDLRRRQADGELGDDLDPAFVLLVLQSAVIARVVFPDDVKRYLGLEPASPEYLEIAEEQLRRIVRRLAGPASDGADTALDPAALDRSGTGGGSTLGRPASAHRRAASACRVQTHDDHVGSRVGLEP
jgi:TetR/AcrR family transcriptional regulator